MRYVRGRVKGIHRLVRAVELATVAGRDRQHVEICNRVAQNPATGVLELNQTCAGKGARDPFLRNEVPARVEQPQSSDQGEDKRLVVWIPLG